MALALFLVPTRTSLTLTSQIKLKRSRFMVMSLSQYDQTRMKSRRSRFQGAKLRSQESLHFNLFLHHQRIALLLLLLTQLYTSMAIHLSTHHWNLTRRTAAVAPTTPPTRRMAPTTPLPLTLRPSLSPLLIPLPTLSQGRTLSPLLILHPLSFIHHSTSLLLASLILLRHSSSF